MVGFVTDLRRVRRRNHGLSVRARIFEHDGNFLHIGPEAERRFGRRYFSDLTAVFSAPPEFTVLAGRNEVGTVGTDLLVEEVEGPRVLLLGGRSWTVTHVDWQRRRCFVEPADSGGKAKWSAALPPGLAEKTLAVRLGDELHARDIVAMRRRIYRTDHGE